MLAGSFDPVCADLIRLSLDTVSAGKADRVLLVLLPYQQAAPYEDRWKMLVAACAGKKELIPLQYPSGYPFPSSAKELLKPIRKLYPDDKLVSVCDSCLSDSDKESGASPISEENLFSLVCPSVEEYILVTGQYGFSPRLENIGPAMDKLFADLKPHRYAHSLAVALTAKNLAARYGEDESRAELAGLLHDCAKCLPLAEMRNIAEEHHLTDDQSFLESGALLHSIVGSFIAETSYHVSDREILDAIAFHNTGHAGMSRLAMCVCLADFIEPNRDSFPSLEAVRTLSEQSLEKALLLSLESTVDHVRAGGKQLHPRTSDTIAWLKSLPAVQI